MDPLESVTSEGYTKSSLRAVIRKGKYKLRCEQNLYDYTKFKLPQKYAEYSENDKNLFLFRFAASKRCIVRKSDESET